MSIKESVERLERNMDEFPLKWELTKYSDEERSVLNNMCESFNLKNARVPWPYDPPGLNFDEVTIENVRIPNVDHRSGLLTELGMLLREPIENMPLLINEFKDVRDIFVKWRLMVGR